MAKRRHTRHDDPAPPFQRLLPIGDDYWIESSHGQRADKVDGKALRVRDASVKIHGNVVDHEYEIERRNDTVAAVSKKWLRVLDSCGIEVRRIAEDPLVLPCRSPSTPWLTTDGPVVDTQPGSPVTTR